MAEDLACKDCGRKFGDRGALDQHVAAKHGPHQQAHAHTHPSGRATIKISTRTIAVASVVCVIVASMVLIFAFGNPFASSAASSGLGQPISSSLYYNVTGVNQYVLNAVGSGTANDLQNVNGAPLVQDGKPVVLYMGAEYCPYCAIERWSMLLALSKFGSFSGVTYMSSSPTDAYPNTATFSFDGASYSSNYVSFQPVETQDRSGNPLRSPTPSQSSIFQANNPSGSIPFVDIGGKYVLVGSQAQPTALSGLSWSQIAEKMNDPNSDVAQSIVGASNLLVKDICSVTDGKPVDVCSQPYAKV